MLPNQLIDFSESFIAVSLFSSNILFWQENGYFDAAAEEKPLLHTWSLAVEEQYYVLFPIFLVFAWRFGKNRVFWMIVVMAATSLLLSEWGWRNKATANFYLAPTRAWELFSGSIVAFILQKQGIQKNNYLALIGLAAIIFSIFAYDEITPFPSIYTLVPVLGVVMVILYSDKETIVAKVLSTKAFVGIGLVSYSAYLWHQPLFAFARIKLINNPSTILMLTLSFASILLAFFSWRFIETPFRKKNIYSRKAIFVISIFGIITALLLGSIGYIKNGFEQRFDFSVIDLVGMEPDKPNWKELLGCKEKDITNLDSIFCEEIFNKEDPKIVIFGDSHAEFIAMSFQHNQRSYVLGRLGGCVPLINVDVVGGNWDQDVCRNVTIKQLDYIKSNPNIEEVLLVARWSLYTSGDYNRSMRNYFLTTSDIISNTQESSRIVFADELAKTIKIYQDLGLTVSVLMQIPQQRYHPIKAISKTYLIGNKENDALLQTPLIQHLDLQDYNRSVIEQIKTTNNKLKLINLDEHFCDEMVCRMLDGKNVLYRDEDHLSRVGAQYISSLLTESLHKD